jgi:hypothetical protein
MKAYKIINEWGDEIDPDQLSIDIQLNGNTLFNWKKILSNEHKKLKVIPK